MRPLPPTRVKLVGRALLGAGAVLCACVTAAADQPIAKVEGDLPPALRDKVELALEVVEEPSRSRAQAKRRLERAAKQLATVLRSEGYYDPDINGRIDEEAPENDAGKTPPLRTVLEVDVGPRYGVGRAEVEFSNTPTGINDADTLDAARAELKLQPGDPAVAGEIIAAGLRVTNYLEQHGYPEAAVPDRRVVLDHERDAVDVTYPVSTGPKVRFGELVQTGDARVGRGWLELIRSYQEGEVFDERKLDEMTARVVGTGVFGQAVATLEETDAANADGTVTRNVILNIDQGPKNTVSGSVGFSTTEGTGVEAIYERRNFVGYAQTLTLRGVARTNEIGLEANYFIPYWTKVERSVTGELAVRRLDTDAFEGEIVEARGIVNEQINERLRVGVGGGVEASRFIQNDVERTAYVADLIGNALYDARDNRLNPTQGFLLSAAASPSFGFGDNDGFFTKVEVAGSAYKQVSREFVLAGRLEAGTLFGSNLDDIPFNRRFYAGGGGSVRGFAFQSIGPVDEFGEATGGRSLVAGAGELRWRSSTLFGGNLGAAVFVDAASVAVPTVADFRDIRYGAGVGIRYFTAFAPLRADIAIPLNPRDGDEAFQIYISIGQAF